jgi:hypothetical protein
MKYKFKIGQQVRCVDNYWNDDLFIPGTIYTVIHQGGDEDSHPDEIYYGLKELGDTKGNWIEGRFEAVHSIEEIDCTCHPNKCFTMACLDCIPRKYP